ncbi:MAG: F0F1 ATP synthase subunit A [Cytophagales bacterium]|nr:F0F1 ATP synthase subunit A [Cytophagales bacterium]
MNKPFFASRTSFLALFLIILTSVFTPVFGSDEAGQKESEPVNISEVILHHVMDDHQWHFADWLVLPLPIIVYSEDKGLDFFMSSKFYDHHKEVEYNGYKLEHNHITLVESGNAVFDLSITKNVLMLLITSALLLIVFGSAAKSAKANKGKAPKGMQSFFEPIILFVRDEIVKPNINSHHVDRFLPYMLTLFFFILFGNLLGLLPGAGNLTGNIAVTMTLAVLTFLITNFNGKKAYWGHIFWTPGVPLPLRIVILPVEIIGMFTKPFSLMIRLFVAITAGHIVLLALICLTFIFGSLIVGFGASIIVLFINLIELLVAGIQAYVFTMFSSMYIGMAVEEGHDH